MKRNLTVKDKLAKVIISATIFILFCSLLLLISLFVRLLYIEFGIMGPFILFAIMGVLFSVIWALNHSRDRELYR
jgi:hypothetical protein